MSNRPGRNDPCPCGSGKKYKNCHAGKEHRLSLATRLWFALIGIMFTKLIILNRKSSGI